MVCNGHCVSIPGPFANNQHVQIISKCNLANIANNPHLRNVGLHPSGCPRDFFGQTYLIGVRCTLGLLVVHVHFRMLRQICWWMDPISQTRVVQVPSCWTAASRFWLKHIRKWNGSWIWSALAAKTWTSGFLWREHTILNRLNSWPSMKIMKPVGDLKLDSQCVQNYIKQFGFIRRNWELTPYWDQASHKSSKPRHQNQWVVETSRNLGWIRSR